MIQRVDIIEGLSTIHSYYFAAYVDILFILPFVYIWKYNTLVLYVTVNELRWLYLDIIGDAEVIEKATDKKENIMVLSLTLIKHFENNC